MANQARTATIMYSGVTTTTDTDVLTMTGFQPSLKGGGIKAFKVQNNHATATLLIATNGTSPSAVGDGVVKVLGTTASAGSPSTVVVPVRTTGTGTAEIRLTGSAACDYTVVALKTY